jgi:hypothetical protein
MTIDTAGNVSIGGAISVASGQKIRIGGTDLTEQMLKILARLASGKLEVAIQTADRGYLLDNYGHRHNDGDNDRTIQFRSNQTIDSATRMRILIA